MAAVTDHGHTGAELGRAIELRVPGHVGHSRDARALSSAHMLRACV